MAALSLAVAATGMTTSPHGEGVASVLHSLDLPSQPSSAEGCPLTKPIVILKSARSASTHLYDKLLEVLPGCSGYPEISHDDDLLRHGCTAKAYQYQEAVWRMALSKNAIITHNPSTQGGGCFSSYFDGEERLTELLEAENATVVSWTRNNVLRQKYSDMAARVSGDYGGHATAADAPRFAQPWWAPLLQTIDAGLLRLLRVRSLSSTEFSLSAARRGAAAPLPEAAARLRALVYLLLHTHAPDDGGEGGGGEGCDGSDCNH